MLELLEFFKIIYQLINSAECNLKLESLENPFGVVKHSIFKGWRMKNENAKKRIPATQKKDSWNFIPSQIQNLGGGGLPAQINIMETIFP